ncbi:DNA-(apurinic or apyrimidinic site) lyase [Oceanobacillus iheyensis HTE831]|uniref:DNA-(Apurinic or apyrimidinic site) lyase n=1 Tax=Oceanobacillus iheyensis (strain DSM 14371 / CIP 107618 / JCM 11309 / KCTC 3954 / HTE831) TaxID=221109 RepID=Q8CUR5_OCEIH|nr:DNA lyase [Oceanobacillus iheyensis]BAC12998.1 DNA-(apurinic or apyrimidinic site) lyase [Oceanobacillus iheyensis HTE831]
MNIPDYLEIYYKLYKYYGPQSWWPARSTLEMLLGSILVQRTNWRNVEKALTRLGDHVHDADYFYQIEENELAEKIRPSGFYRIKAARIKAFITWFRKYNYDVSIVQQIPHDKLRSELLSIKGIGDETADVMLVYAFKKQAFIADQYANRIFNRIGLNVPSTYRSLQKVVERDLPNDSLLYQEYHALLVEHAKIHCKVKPICNTCPVQTICEFGLNKLGEFRG